MYYVSEGLLKPRSFLTHNITDMDIYASSDSASIK